MTTLQHAPAPAAGWPPGRPRLLAQAPLTPAEQRRDRTPVPAYDAEGLVRLLDSAGLTGRGGGGFPTGRKLRAVAAARGRGVVVVNGMEGEPLSQKDAVLLTRVPDLVLDGLDVLGQALRARRRVVAVGDHVHSAPVTEAATLRRGVRVEVLGGGFLAGQETALLRRLDGGPAAPTDPGVRVTERGLRGAPTLVVNAETAAHVGLLARHGAEWFRGAGLPGDPGTFLATVSGSTADVVRRPGVVEAGRGVPLALLLAGAGVRTDRVQAVLVGGYHGAWVPARALGRVLMTRGDLAAYGAAVGAGVVHVLDRDDCPLAASAGVADYLAAQSARQCGPCVNGLPAMARTLDALAAPGARPGLVTELQQLQALVDGRGACTHPDGTARFLASTLRVFADHVDAHLEGTCHATVAR